MFAKNVSKENNQPKEMPTINQENLLAKNVSKESNQPKQSTKKRNLPAKIGKHTKRKEQRNSSKLSNLQKTT